MKKRGISAVALLLLCVAIWTHPLAVSAMTPLSSSNFDSAKYAETYPDLMNAFGYDHALLWSHYENSGVFEGRTAYATNGDLGILLKKETFDFVRYADENPDLKQAFGYNKDALWNHLQTSGLTEGRAAYATTDEIGIDVSSYQGEIDWRKVKEAGITYAIIRLGYRGSTVGNIITDARFHKNIQGAQAAGLRVGVYFVTQAVNEQEAVAEANHCLNVLAGYGLQMPVFVDVEGTGGRGDTINRATRTAVVKTFCATMTAGGRSAGVYTSKNWMVSNIDMSQLTQYSIWLAQYRSAPTWTGTRIDLWQFSSNGTVPGIAGRVDVNRVYVKW